MKITGTSKYIVVHINNKKVKVQGEMLVGGFLAYTDTIKHWESPHDNEQIDANTRDEIKNAIINYTEHSSFKIEFD
jgi:hypothetical protein